MKLVNILTMSLWTAALFIIGVKANAQVASGEECQAITSESLYRQFLEDVPKIQEFTAEEAAQRWPGQEIPVYFTIFRDDDGSFTGQEPSQAVINEALARLDSLFAPINLHFVQCGAINYVDHSGLAEFNAHRHLMDLSYVSTALNVYTRSGTGSFAQFPSNVNPNNTYSTPAVSSKNNLMSLSGSGYLSPTFAHEAGHSFGLVHTFEGARVYNNPHEPASNYHGGFQDHPYGQYNNNSWRRELALRSPDSTLAFPLPNASVSGDFVEDTPAFCKRSNSYFPNWADTGCQSYPYTGSECTGCIIYNCNYEGDYIDYNGHELRDTELSIRNIMSYTGSCRREFTPGQYERMAYYHATVRSQQYDASFCTNLQDEVAFEGTNIGIDDVLIMYSHESTYRHCNTITNTNGQFQGILYAPQASAYLLKIGSNPDPSFDDDPGDYIVPGTKVILEHSYLPEDWLQGITIRDALLIHQHLLGTATLDGYKQIAADLDKDGAVTLQDSWLLLSLLAGDIHSLPAHKSPWRFVPEYIPQKYPSAFHSNPFNMTIDSATYEHRAPYLEEDWVLPVSDSLAGMNGFDGVKLGDLDRSSIPSDPYSVEYRGCRAERVELLYDNLPLAAGQAVELEVRLATAKAISAFQMAIRLDTNLIGMEGIHSGGLASFSPERNAGYRKNRNRELRIAWVAENALPRRLEPEEALFRLTLRAKKALPDLREALRLDSALLQPVFLGEAACPLPLKLVVGERKAGSKKEQERLKCYPNPTRDQLSLVFHSDTAGPGGLSILDAVGKLIIAEAINLKPGWNEARFGLNGLPAGLYVLSLKGPEGNFTEKFLKMD